ncbi:helix-turn-helix domain-containing protein [Desulfosporosinus hippei]|uniref:AraC-type DNA-binding protein n=1 Tax=Desulfosporosinus hippei DSM 8344 TaxID=1121419 RepID=A0A1G8G1U7_9FIRM|nr:AraC family transcriptional regulator [Desulfosporosinus hippei]SDH88388.1 AraC-type DNA-binding protein [Desulfosporosinus hippei DSM 8344]
MMSFIDSYYDYIMKKYGCQTYDQLLGKSYLLGDGCREGNIERMNIENGLEISNILINGTIDLDFQNQRCPEVIIEVGYCYSGSARIRALPSDREYEIKCGEIFVYNMVNDEERFIFEYKDASFISIHINFDLINNAVNPIWEARIIDEWQTMMRNLFTNEILIIRKISYNLKIIAEEIKQIQRNNMLGYFKLKLKVLEFIAVFFEDKWYEQKLSKQAQNDEIIKKAEEIIHSNLENPPLIRDLAEQLNTSVYKLQVGFKRLTGETVHDYIKILRLEKAKYYLVHTDKSIIDICNEIGYENASKFAKLFKHHNGVAPLRYRKTKKSKQQ